MKKVIIIGATSGIGYELAKGYVKKGWRVGVAGRRIETLEIFKSSAPDQIEIEQIDVTETDSPQQLQRLIDKVGGMDLFILSAGVGNQNRKLNPDIELATAQTNVVGFIRMVTFAYQYFKEQRKGHLAVISSIAGTKGLGSAPAYSATKRFQNTYIDALAQLARMERLSIQFTDIRPGFVATALLKNRKYPLLMRADSTAQHIVKALTNKKRVAIIDTRYAILVFFWQLIPRWVWERLPIRNDKS